MPTKKELEEHIQFLSEEYIKASKSAVENANQVKRLIAICEEQRELISHAKTSCDEISSMYTSAWRRCPVNLRGHVFQVPVLEGAMLHQ